MRAWGFGQRAKGVGHKHGILEIGIRNLENKDCRMQQLESRKLNAQRWQEKGLWDYCGRHEYVPFVFGCYHLKMNMHNGILPNALSFRSGWERSEFPDSPF